RRLERDERRCAELHAPRSRPTVGHDVAAELTAWGLDSEIELALGDAIPLRDDLEVVDERLHRRVELFARWEYDLAVVRDPRPLGHTPKRLVDDPHRFALLGHATAITRVGVALGGK